MKILYIFIFVFSFTLYARDFTVASYNVENLFDLKYDGTEYKEYKPNTKTWNKKSFQNKIHNISQVLNDLDADIIALQEIESKEALEQLVRYIKKYKHHQFLKKNSSSVGVAILSKFPIKNYKKIPVDTRDKYTRPILKAIITIENKDIIIYVNHWRSKRAAESKRIVYAMALKKEIDSLDENQDYIILGDLNSNYNEFQTFKYDKKLNDTFGITGINQILNTTIENNFITKSNIFSFHSKVHYNLWLELKKERFSSLFKTEENTPDNIILSKGLFDQKNISYVNNSFKVFKPDYLIINKRIKRWNSYKKTGYSDHLPIYATFSTTKQTPIEIQNKSKNTQTNTIKQLYELQTVTNYNVTNVVVIYLSTKIAIIQKENDRAIMIYKPDTKLVTGFSYNFTVDEIDLYNGLKEIKSISNIVQKEKISNYKDYYLDALEIDLFDNKYQNNIITNLTGIYKKGYLYFKTKNNNEKKIKLYFDKKLKRPKESEQITISSGHLSIYKSKIQIVLHKQNDFF